ncbi:MAG: Uma2 family endonuclease [Gammaproteobacteria bacterium]|nr:Uma2 family endonuclease [Gammaproteobacteria bacterium]
MEAFKLKTLADLFDASDERVELIDGEIVQRPMARIEHGFVQSNTIAELDSLRRTSGPRGWWIASEVSVHYSAHQCPTHDLAGWRKERLPERPSGVVEIVPDWVCEIVSPGHERKDTLTLFLLLQQQQVSYYWLIWPEERSLVAWQLDGGSYRVIASVAAPGVDERKMRIPPFDAVEIDLGYILGD